MRKNHRGHALLSGKHIWEPARHYHRHHTLTLNGDGLQVRHLYPASERKKLSWGDDVGFVFAKRQVMVWWEHPRMAYLHKLEDLASQQCVDQFPKKEVPFADTTPCRKRIGRGLRVKIKGYQSASIGDAYLRYFDCEQNAQEILSKQDHQWVIRPSVKTTVLDWCQGVHLVLPVEIHDEQDLFFLKDVSQRFLRGDTSFLADYENYTFSDWVADHA